MYTFISYLTLAIAFIAPVFIIKVLHINGVFKKVITYITSFLIIFIIGALVSDVFKTDADRAEDAKQAKLNEIEQIKEDSIQAIQDSIDWNKSSENEYLVKEVAVEYLKNHLKDPDSYKEYDNGVLIVQNTGNNYVVWIKYRATNSFGGVISDTKLVEVISNYKTESCRAIGFYNK